MTIAGMIGSIDGAGPFAGNTGKALAEREALSVLIPTVSKGTETEEEEDAERRTYDIFQRPPGP
jgi:hypothetical protein